MATGMSLHIGLNSVNPRQYSGWSGPLTACEADANDMASLAKTQKFTSKKLLTKSATRAAVKSVLRRLRSSTVDGSAPTPVPLATPAPNDDMDDDTPPPAAESAHGLQEQPR